MISRLHNNLTYANVMATIAVFIALSGTSYAAITITGKNVRDGSLTGRDVRNGSITDVDLAENIGTEGPQGVSGPQGASGPQGLIGPQGIQGVPGVTGQVGSAGAPGLPGLAGPAGEDGSDAEFNGAAAGGDLTGSYPNPGLAEQPAVRLEGPNGCLGSGATLNAVTNNVLTTIVWQDPGGSASFLAGGAMGGNNAGCTSGGVDYFLATKTGIYAFGATIAWTNNSSLLGRREVVIAKQTPSGSVVYVASVNDNAVEGVQFQPLSTLVRLEQGDSLRVLVIQNSGTVIPLFQGSRANVWMHYVGRSS